MIRRLWTKLHGMFERSAPPLAEVGEPTSAKVLAAKSGTPMSAGNTIVSPRLFELAQAGDVDAQAALGEHYFDDHEEHYAASFQWNGLAAQAGHIGAQGRLASIYHEGLGVERDPEKAFRWWYSAARQNHRGAQLMVAAAYVGGTVVKADLPEAAYWASLSYLNARGDPEKLELVDPYYRWVLNKLSDEQKLALIERLERQMKRD